MELREVVGIKIVDMGKRVRRGRRGGILLERRAKRKLREVRMFRRKGRWRKWNKGKR